MKSEPVFKEGDIVVVNGATLKCSFVSWRERDGKKEMFTYSFYQVEPQKKNNKKEGDK